MSDISVVTLFCTINYKNTAKEKLQTHLENDFLDVQEDTSIENLRTSLCKNQTSWEMNIFNPPSNICGPAFPFHRGNSRTNSKLVIVLISDI